jgi:hypothetical protein
MPRATLLPGAIAAVLLIALACGGGGSEKPAPTPEGTRKPTPTSVPIPHETIAAGAVCNAAAVRADLDPFYCWAVDVGGVAIVASRAVDYAAVNTAAESVAEMLRFREDIRERLARLGPKIIIVGPNELITDAPELRHMSNSSLYDERGYGQLRGWSGGVIATVGAEGIVGLDAVSSARDDVMVHEFAHLLHALGLTTEEWTASRTVYSQSRASGRWQGTYAGRNYNEFFAELTQIYFGVKGAAYQVNGPEELRRYDPDVADFLEQIYGPR